VTEDKATRYHRLKRRAELLDLAWSGILLVTLVVSGGAALLRDVALQLTGGHFYFAIVLVALALGALHSVVSVPLAIFSGFVLERRYELSRQSFRGWLNDYLKGLAVGVLLGLPALLLVYYTMAQVPGWWWAIAGAVFAVLIIGLANVAPVLLLPLFFSFTPLRSQELRARLEMLAARAGTRILGVYEWALGAKTRKANAALTGLGATRRILVSDTMLEQYSDDEIEVVLAHELGHHVHHDIWRALALETALILLGFFAADFTLRTIGGRLGLEALTDPAGVPLLLAAAGVASLVLMPFGLALSRRHERRADRFALDLTSNPGAFVTAMRRLGAQNLAEDRPSRLVEWLFYSHPPLEERLEAARAWTPPSTVRPR
jgi:Zn-dependent protease with chaperone function